MQKSVFHVSALQPRVDHRLMRLKNTVKQIPSNLFAFYPILIVCFTLYEVFFIFSFFSFLQRIKYILMPHFEFRGSYRNLFHQMCSCGWTSQDSHLCKTPFDHETFRPLVGSQRRKIADVCLDFSWQNVAYFSK